MTTFTLTGFYMHAAHACYKGVARFATGEIELNDETYAAWLSELKAAGSDELLALYR